MTRRLPPLLHLPFLASFLGLLSLLALTSCAQEAARGPVVLAAASLQEALGEVADGWQAAGHARPVLSFAGTSSLARQVDGGAPADIFFSADNDWMDWLEERALIRPETRREVLGNSLVFIAGNAQDAALPLDQRMALLADERIAMADPGAVPAGRYARAGLEAMGLWDAVAERIVPTENVRAALALVERGEVRFGIVYATDALASDKVVVAQTIPLPEAMEITYPAALLAASTHGDAGAFLDYLGGAEAGEVFRAHGFPPAPTTRLCDRHVE